MFITLLKNIVFTILFLHYQTSVINHKTCLRLSFIHMATKSSKRALILNLDYWKTSDAHVNTHPGCPVVSYLQQNQSSPVQLYPIYSKTKTELCKISNRKAENIIMMWGKKSWHSLEKYQCYHMAEWSGKKMVLWYIVKVRKHEMWAGVFLKGWRIKSRLWKQRESNSGDIYNSETEYEQSRSALGHEMAARTQWGKERECWEWGVYWDIMDTGAEGGRVRRAGVEKCSCKSYPCVTLET